MKKFVIALMAAVMALSTSAVAHAKDTDVSGSLSNVPTLEAATTAPTTDILYGEKSEFALSTEVLSSDVLGELFALDAIKFDVTVTEGRDLMKKAPTITLAKTKEGSNLAKLTLDVKDTYNTDIDENSGNKDITLRVRITALKDFTEGKFSMKKGDTLSIDEIAFNAYYRELAAYGKDMTITAEEVADKYVVVDMDGLREVETATFYFDDTAAFTVKISEAQKNLNLAYSTVVADKYYEKYPELEFEVIEFFGTPKFLHNGTLTFNAIGEDDTVIYEITKNGLVEMDIADYNAMYNTVTVKGVSTLTSYLIASDSLTTHFVPSPTPDIAPETNPNTGAC